MIRRVKSSEFYQTAVWLHQAIFKYDENNELLLKRFQETYYDYEVDPDAEAINILCLDAGALRGRWALFVLYSVC